jgi:hypothetical protein
MTLRPSLRRAGVAAAVALPCTACGHATRAGAAAVPPQLQPPAGQAFASVLKAAGVQLYECRAAAGGGTQWVFVAPDAQLFDEGGRHAGRHYAGPHWEAPDGSKVIGAVQARADAPATGAIPWLLLASRPAGGTTGAFSRVTSIQRVNTTGGVAPSGACAAGEMARVPYTADYRFFTAGS